MMTAGPFRTFSHQYRFSPHGDGTLMEDTFAFESPMWMLGRLADRILLLGAMRSAQEERLQAIKAASENGDAANFL